MQYIPGNLRALAKDKRNYAIGTVYDGKACGAALCEATNTGCYLRSVFVDPAVRLCGVGTLLLRGLLGVVGADGWDELVFIYTEDMLERAPLSGCFTRAGFSTPSPVSTFFSAPLDSITLPEVYTDAAVYSFDRVPGNVWEQYQALTECGKYPPYVDAKMVNADDIVNKCSFIAVDHEGQPAGVILVLKQDEGLYVNGVFVPERQRSTRMGMGLMFAALHAARLRYPGTTNVSVSTINAMSFKICDSAFDNKVRTKYTEFKVSYTF